MDCYNLRRYDLELIQIKQKIKRTATASESNANLTLVGNSPIHSTYIVSILNYTLLDSVY